jgi:hypothetical protein
VSYIGFVLEVSAQSLEVLFELVEGGVDVPFWVVGAAQGNIDDIVGVLLGVPAPKVRFDLLALIDS